MPPYTTNHIITCEILKQLQLGKNVTATRSRNNEPSRKNLLPGEKEFDL